jgi:hypothetical protein
VGSAPSDPIDRRDSSRYHQRVSDTWPPPGPQKRPPTLEHVKDLWTLHWSESNCTAAIWRNDFGLEPRVLHGDELIESCLSIYGGAHDRGRAEGGTDAERMVGREPRAAYDLGHHRRTRKHFLKSCSQSLGYALRFGPRKQAICAIHELAVLNPLLNEP